MFTFTSKTRNVTLALMAVGIAAIIYGFATDPVRAWASLLHNTFYFNAIALCGLFFVGIHYVAEAGWSSGFIRVPMAMAQFLRYGCGALILIFILNTHIGNHSLYSWTESQLYDPHSPEYDHIIAGKAGFLNEPFFII